MARRSAIPYPPSPTDYPDELTDPGPAAAAHTIAVLAGLMLFLFVYFGCMFGSFAAIVVPISRVNDPVNIVLCILAMPIALIFALILVKGLFAGSPADRHMRVEITEDDQPVFFSFIRKLTGEIGAPMPHRVFVSPEVNAAMMQEISVLNLIVPPKKNLLVGLGLVNTLNLSEFKAVMGHEFGHFSQKTSRLQAYTYLANRIMVNLIQGEDWLDRMLASAKRTVDRNGGGDGAAIPWMFWVTVGGSVWIVRKTMLGIFYTINLASLSLSRQNEFHADRIAVSVSGSNAIVHALARLDFAQQCYYEAINDLEVARQNKLYSRDLFVHQSGAASRLRKRKNDSKLGLPPSLKHPREGKKVQVFDEDDDSGIPLMWSTHPINADREDNAKEIFVEAEDDERSPWELFEDKADLRERATYRMYRVVFNAKKDIKLSRAEEVEKFFDREDAELSYDPKYCGAYDNRVLCPGILKELNELVERETWSVQRMNEVQAGLYKKLGRQIGDLKAVTKDIREVYRKSFGDPRGRERRRLESYEREFEELMAWFASFDRRVYLVYGLMARQLGGDRQKALIKRYEFHLRLQTMTLDVRNAQERVEDIMLGFEHYAGQQPYDFFQFVQSMFRDARRTMVDVLSEASDMPCPKLANVNEGTMLDTLIFEGKVIREVARSSISGRWIAELHRQLEMVRTRMTRVVFKSLGSILQMHDQIAADWREKIALPQEIGGDALPEAVIIEDPPEPKLGPDAWE